MKTIETNIALDIIRKHLTEFQMKQFVFHYGCTTFGIDIKNVTTTLNHLGHLSNLDKAKNKDYKISQEVLKEINLELKAQLNIERKPKLNKIKRQHKESKFLRCGCPKDEKYCYCGSKTSGVIDY